MAQRIGERGLPVAAGAAQRRGDGHRVTTCVEETALELVELLGARDEAVRQRVGHERHPLLAGWSREHLDKPRSTLGNVDVVTMRAFHPARQTGKIELTGAETGDTFLPSCRASFHSRATYGERNAAGDSTSTTCSTLRIAASTWRHQSSPPSRSRDRGTRKDPRPRATSAGVERTQGRPCVSRRRTRADVLGPALANEIFQQSACVEEPACCSPNLTSPASETPARTPAQRSSTPLQVTAADACTMGAYSRG